VSSELLRRERMSARRVVPDLLEGVVEDVMVVWVLEVTGDPTYSAKFG
jgi:hypothetical protein